MLSFFFPLEMQQIFFKDGLEFSLEIGFFSVVCVVGFTICLLKSQV